MCGAAIPESALVPQTEEERASANEPLVGDVSKHRMLAASFDHLMAFILACAVATQLSFLTDFGMGMAFYGVFLTYFFVFEAKWCHTPGKWFFGLRVARLDGSPCSAIQAAVRAVIRPLEIGIFALISFIGFTLFYAGEKGQTLSDRVAGTLVLST